MTSSIGAIMPPLNGPTGLDEENWADEFVSIVERRGKDASSVEKYIASKTLSERGERMQSAYRFHLELNLFSIKRLGISKQNIRRKLGGILLCLIPLM